MNITTLEQAGKHLMDQGVVDFDNMTVEGKQLLEVCGYTVKENKKINQEIKRQIEKHNFKEGGYFKSHTDVTSESRKKPMVYQFSMNAANHVLLAAMTERGKVARQQAIDLKTTVDENGGQQMLMDFIEQQKQFMVEMQEGFKSTRNLQSRRKRKRRILCL